MSGTQAELQEITRRYGAFYRKVEVPGSAMAYTIDHSAILYVLDKQGKAQEQVQHAVPPAEFGCRYPPLVVRFTVCGTACADNGQGSATVPAANRGVPVQYFFQLLAVLRTPWYM